MSSCRSCGAEVVFVPSAKSGKQMILDARPTKGIVAVHAVDEFFLVLLDDPDARARVVNVYTDHHATCPDVAAWRRGRQDGEPQPVTAVVGSSPASTVKGGRVTPGPSVFAGGH